MRGGSPAGLEGFCCCQVAREPVKGMSVTFERGDLSPADSQQVKDLSPTITRN